MKEVQGCGEAPAVEPAETGAARGATPTPEHCFQHIPETGPQHLYRICSSFELTMSYFRIFCHHLLCEYYLLCSLYSEELHFSPLVNSPSCGWIHFGMIDFKQL